MSSRKQHIEDIVENMYAIKRRIVACTLIKAGEKPSIASITPAQWAIIKAISEKEKATTGTVAETLQISSSAATQLVEGLVENGYVVREVDKADRRASILKIPAAHKEKMAQMKAATTERLTTLFDVLSDDDIALYATLNKKIIEGNK